MSEPAIREAVKKAKGRGWNSEKAWEMLDGQLNDAARSGRRPTFSKEEQKAIVDKPKSSKQERERPATALPVIYNVFDDIIKQDNAPGPI